MESIWTQDYQHNAVEALSGVIETDTAIIGGGLAGVLCAYMLQARGVDCVIIEAKKTGLGVTGNTTAKVTAQHGIIYSKIEKKYGLKAAKDYYKANSEAVDEYRQLARMIDCDFEDKTAYVYTLNNRKKLIDEAKAYERIGINLEFVENPAIPIKTQGTLGMTNQAQFHPLKFLNHIKSGIRIYEDTFATDIKHGVVITTKGIVNAKRIILATHYPMVNIPGLYFTKLYQHRSYVVALEGADDPNGMYIDEQDTGFSFRSYKNYLLLGGGAHRTGKTGCGWDDLRLYAAATYPDAKERFAWATQDCMTLDSMPYIGQHRKNNRELFVVTGFNKWGMTGSMVAAKLLCELITEGKSPYAQLFSPSRSMLHPQLFVNLGDSAVGLLSLRKPRCTHMGCALKWNPHEHTYDCPCHGSRFERDGELINNPAKKGIKTK